MMTWVLLFGFALGLSALAIRIGIPLAHRFGVVDQPGGHKAHDRITPFIGGVGVVVALLASLAPIQQISGSTDWVAVGLGALLMFATGLADDILRLGFKLRFLIQTLTALLMVFFGGVALSDLGHLAYGELLYLGVWGVPLTIFATVGVINALNMIDGIDGLSGSVSLVSLVLIAMLALAAQTLDYLALAVVLLGGLTGFLYFNLRFLSHRRARVFLGDNGSMLLGFLFAWLLIAMSQEPRRVITPVTALWLFSVPLMDTLGVMLRRMWLGKSPFHPDRHHLHHLFIRAGFRVQDTVYAIAMIQLAMGLAGIVGMQMGIAEGWMLAAYLLVFAGYFYLVSRPWRFVPALRRLHTLLELTSPDTRGVFLGNCALEGAPQLIEGLSEEMQSRDDYRLGVYKTTRHGRTEPYVYAVLEILAEDNDAASEEVRVLVDALKRRFKGQDGIRVRHFLSRSPVNDRRVGVKPISSDLRQVERRARHSKQLIHAEHGSDGVIAVPA